MNDLTREIDPSEVSLAISAANNGRSIDEILDEVSAPRTFK
jgi:hypothetical protein